MREMLELARDRLGALRARSPSTTTARSPSATATSPCALQGLELAEGLPVLNLTCVVGWDLPRDEDIPARVGLRAGEGLFGTLGATASERGWDVTLRYAFPAAGLGEAALGTLLMLVVSNASAVRAELRRAARPPAWATPANGLQPPQRDSSIRSDPAASGDDAHPGPLACPAAAGRSARRSGSRVAR